jgi:hypothetical protein
MLQQDERHFGVTGGVRKRRELLRAREALNRERQLGAAGEHGLHALVQFGRRHRNRHDQLRG